MNYASRMRWSVKPSIPAVVGNKYAKGVCSVMAIEEHVWQISLKSQKRKGEHGDLVVRGMLRFQINTANLTKTDHWHKLRERHC